MPEEAARPAAGPAVIGLAPPNLIIGCSRCRYTSGCLTCRNGQTPASMAMNTMKTGSLVCKNIDQTNDIVRCVFGCVSTNAFGCACVPLCLLSLLCMCRLGHVIVCLPVCLFACLPVSLSICLLACLPACQSVCFYSHYWPRARQLQDRPGARQLRDPPGARQLKDPPWARRLSREVVTIQC